MSGDYGPSSLLQKWTIAKRECRAACVSRTRGLRAIAEKKCSFVAWSNLAPRELKTSSTLGGQAVLLRRLVYRVRNPLPLRQDLKDYQIPGLTKRVGHYFQTLTVSGYGQHVIDAPLWSKCGSIIVAFLQHIPQEVSHAVLTHRCREGSCLIAFKNTSRYLI